jgi:glycosyltransferase involved in cell wall biosynthesis
MTITTVIITFNEALQIGKCIESVLPFSDEIIVVDSFSTDKTIEIAASFPKTKVYQRIFDNYILQKNYANSLALSDFIFSLDADEWASDALQTYFFDHKNSLPQIASFPRINKIGTKSILHGTWYPDRKIRFWQKSYAQWAGTTPHEHLAFSKDIIDTKLTFPIIHQAYSDTHSLWLKSKKYATLASQGLSKKTWISIGVSLLFSPMIKFFKGYFLKKGFLNGKMGFLIEFTIFVETFSKYYQAAIIKLGKKNSS